MAGHQMFRRKSGSNARVKILRLSHGLTYGSGRAKRVGAKSLVTIVGLGVIATQTIVAGGATAGTVQRQSPIALAKKALLVKTDFPKSWTSSRSSSGNSSFPGATQLAHCIGVPASVVNSNPPSADSPEFDGPGHLLTVDDTVSIYPSAKAASADYDSLANSKTPACLTQVLNGTAKMSLEKEFGASIVGSIKVSRVPGAYLAPGGANFTMSMQLKSQGVQLGVDLTIIAYVHANEEQNISLISVGTGFPASLAKQLTTVAARRIK